MPESTMTEERFRDGRSRVGWGPVCCNGLAMKRLTPAERRSPQGSRPSQENHWHLYKGASYPVSN